MITLDFTGKTAIVTGGSRGIGRAVAEALLKLNCSVCITSTQVNAPSWTQHYDNCKYIKLDLVKSRTITSFYKKISSLNKIDILVNNAGIQIPEAIYAITEEGWYKVLEVNLYGPMRLMRYVAKRMKKAKSGRIVNISSISAIISKQNSSAYSASKCGLIGLTRGCALDLAADGILVNALCPGYTETDMMNTVSKKHRNIFKNSVPLGRFASVDEIANFVVFLCSDLNTYITGQAIVVDGGVTIQ